MTKQKDIFENNLKLSTINKSKIKKMSGFGIFKGMRPFTREDEFDSCIDKLVIKNKKIKS